jgi:hypothetical protein
MRVFLAIRVVFEGMDYSFTGNTFVLREEPSLSWTVYLEVRLFSWRALPLPMKKACLHLPGTGIGRNGGLPSAGGFAGGFRDKTFFVKFPHLGFGNSAYLV